MDFESATHGLSFTGMQQYKDEIQMSVFQKVKDKINDTSDIQKAVNQVWKGTSADNFIANIIKGAQMMSEQISDIQTMLDTELDGIRDQLSDMDATLVDRE